MTPTLFALFGLRALTLCKKDFQPLPLMHCTYPTRGDSIYWSIVFTIRVLNLAGDLPLFIRVRNTQREGVYR